MRSWMSRIERTRPSDGKHVAQRLAIHVRVAVGEAGNDGLALRSMTRVVGRRMRRHRVVRTDRDDPVAGDGDRLGDRERRHRR